MENPREQTAWFLPEKMAKEKKEIKRDVLTNNNIWTLFIIELKQLNKN